MTKREFERRLEAATVFEVKVVAALIERDWRAERFGQGQLSEEMRDVIRQVQTSVRYMPDVIAAKKFKAVNRLMFVDAKAGEKYRETGNHDVETAALEGAEKWQQFSDCPVYFVFTNGDTITPQVFRELGKPGPYRGVGSGTPFLLIPRSACTPFDATFGPRTAWMDGIAS
jgi:hypothetical protein